MPFLTAIGDFITKNWHEENHDHLQKSNLQSEKYLTPQQELILLISTAQSGKYEETIKFYTSLSNFKQAPYAQIVCAQIMLAMADANEKKMLSDVLNLSISFLNAAIKEFNQTPENEQQSWPYLITLAEIKIRKQEIDSAEKILELLILNENLFPKFAEKNYLFCTILLLAKAYLHKFANLKINQAQTQDEISIVHTKLNDLIKNLKEMQLDAQQKEILPILAALECEFLILSVEDKIAHLSMIHANVALEMHDIYKSDSNFYLRDFLLDDSTRHRMEGIFQLTYAMEFLLQKQQELEQNLSRKSKRKNIEIKTHQELKNINEILNKNLPGLLNRNDPAIKSFIDALDLAKSQDGPLIKLHYKNIFKNIFLALVLLGIGYLEPIPL